MSSTDQQNAIILGSYCGCYVCFLRLQKLLNADNSNKSVFFLQILATLQTVKELSLIDNIAYDFHVQLPPF